MTDTPNSPANPPDSAPPAPGETPQVPAPNSTPPLTPETPATTPAEKPHPTIDDYLPGAKDEYGQTIKRVIGKHRHLVVYITDTGKPCWRYHELPERLRPAVAQLQVETGFATACLVGKKRRLQAAVLLAQALYAALLTPEGADPLTHYAQPHAFIQKKATQMTRLIYILLTLLCSTLLIGLALAFYALYPDHSGLRSALLVAVSGGVLGASISVMQRSKDLSVDPLDAAYLLVINGVVRVTLGACFGFLMVVAVKANIVLGHFEHDTWALLGLSAGAGFTERWVPELLGHHGGG